MENKKKQKQKSITKPIKKNYKKDCKSIRYKNMLDDDRERKKIIYEKLLL